MEPFHSKRKSQKRKSRLKRNGKFLNERKKNVELSFTVFHFFEMTEARNTILTLIN